VTTYAALLRAVNLGTHQRVTMADLVRMVTGLGYRNPRTLLASGNLVFEGESEAPRQVERRLEEGAKHDLGLETPILVRTAGELAQVLREEPFPKEIRDDPEHVLVVFLRDRPGPKAWADLRAAIQGPERLQAGGREAFLYYAGGIGHSKLTGAVIDRALGTVGTGRNWKTVRKIADAAGPARG
jgi:uncharacterized protein (DUF1697 family)